MRESVESARAFIDYLQVPAFLISLGTPVDFRIERINGAYEASVGLKNSDVEGRSLADVLPAKVAQHLQENYLACVRRRAGYSYEELLQLGDEERWWSTVLSPLFDDNDEVAGVLGIAQDITAAKSIEKTLARSLQTVSSINADLQALTKTTAHDLRGPMRQAKLILDMISEDGEGLGEDKISLLNAGQEVVDKALTLIDERVATVKDRHEIGTVYSTIQLGRWCSEIAAVLDPLGRLNFEYPDLTVECEQFVLDIGLRNLIDNAVKNTSTRVDIEADAEDGVITLTVKDDGRGFPEAFNLETLDRATGIIKDQEVSGLGLVTTKRLIEARHGRLWIDELSSANAPGASVAFSVPGRISN